jgi:hypothetical protein
MTTTAPAPIKYTYSMFRDFRLLSKVLTNTDLLEEMSEELKSEVEPLIKSLEQKHHEMNSSLPQLNEGGCLKGRSISYSVTYREPDYWSETIQDTIQNWFDSDESVDPVELVMTLSENDIPCGSEIEDWELIIE